MTWVPRTGRPERRAVRRATVLLLAVMLAAALRASAALAHHGGAHGGGGHGGGRGADAGTLLALGGVGIVVIGGIVLWILHDARDHAPASGRPRQRAAGGGRSTKRPPKRGPARARARAARRKNR